MKRNREQVLKYIKENSVKDSNGCLIWQRSWAGSRKYAAISYESKGWRVTRLLWTLLNGKIQPGLLVMHKCDNTLCVNIKHLKLGTHFDNMLDAKNKKRFRGQQKTECLRGHKYTKENTAYDSRGKRNCKTCHRLWMRERNGYIEKRVYP